MDVQIAGPSRIPLDYEPDFSSFTFKDRQRQLVSNQKAERILGASVPASFLKFDSSTCKGGSSKTIEHELVILNSPVSPLSKCPTSFLPWNNRLPTYVQLCRIFDSNDTQISRQ